MSQFQLNIQFTTADVHQINAVNQKVVLVKEVGGASGSTVAWITFSPFENNQISWEEEYGVYASTSSVEAGAEIIKTSAVNPAADAVIYPFETGAFDSPTGNIGANNYAIENETSQTLTFGLAQSVTANGSIFAANPLNAVQVLTNEQAKFTPIEKVKVFLHGEFNNGVIITNITSSALELDLTVNPSMTIHYDSTQGRFMLGALAVAA